MRHGRDQQNMEQIAKLVKESAVGAQQSAKACQDLSGLALDLQNMVQLSIWTVEISRLLPQPFSYPAKPTEDAAARSFAARCYRPRLTEAIQMDRNLADQYRRAGISLHG